MLPNEKVSQPAPTSAHRSVLATLNNDEMCLMTARQIFRIIILLNQVHSLDNEDWEAVSTLAAIGYDHLAAAEERLYPADTPTA